MCRTPSRTSGARTVKPSRTSASAGSAPCSTFRTPSRCVDAGAHYQNYGDDINVYPIDTGRLRRVVELVAEKAQWGRSLPTGHGLGIAVHRSFVSYVAIVVEAAVGKDGTVSVPRVDMAVDCGFAAYPDRIRSQMEGAAVMALSSALYGEITFREG